MGGGAETVKGFNGAQGLKNASMDWLVFSGLFDLAPLAPFARVRQAFDAR